MKANTLDEILAQYFTWKGEAITEINQTANYKRMKQSLEALITKAELTILEEVHVKIAQIPDLDLEDYQKVSKVIRKLKENK